MAENYLNKLGKWRPYEAEISSSQEATLTSPTRPAQAGMLAPFAPTMAMGSRLARKYPHAPGTIAATLSTLASPIQNARKCRTVPWIPLAAMTTAGCLAPSLPLLPWRSQSQRLRLILQEGIKVHPLLIKDSLTLNEHRPSLLTKTGSRIIG